MSQVHLGYWTDWSHGAILGATLTLSKHGGALLLSFVATFVTIATARLWRIISYAGHQLQAQPGAHDALHFQRQSILRNVSAPFSAAWMFLLQWWYWKKHTQGVIRRTIPWSLAAVLFALASAAAAILSSEISTSTTKARLLRSSQCGYWVPNTSLKDQIQTSATWLAKQAVDSRTAMTYARECYEQADSPVTAACTAFAQPNIKYTTNGSVACPFVAGNVCLDNLALEMKSQTMDTHVDLGINARAEDRLSMQMKTTCFPLSTAGYWSYVSANESAAQGWPDQVLIDYSYGPLISDTEVYQNATFRYNTYETHMGDIYTVSVQTADANATTGWIPVPEIFSQTADTTLAFITFGSVYFLSENKDPIFNATIPVVETVAGVNDTVWEPARWVAPLHCTHQYQVCNPAAGHCAPWVGRRQLGAPAYISELSGINDAQRATYERLVFAAEFTSFYDLINPHKADALRASEKVTNLQQLDIPENQWQIEAQSWFEASLAALQRATQEYAEPAQLSGPGVNLVKLYEDMTLSAGERSALKDMCSSQRIMASDSTISFSVLGLAVTFAVGVFIILASLVMEEVVDLIRKTTHRGRLQSLAWISDATLNTQQQLLEHKAGMSGWQDLACTIPTTAEEVRVSSTGTLVKDTHIVSVVDQK